MLIFQGQHWRSPAKKLEEEPDNKITGLAEKTRGKEKLKLILISLKSMAERNGTYSMFHVT